MRITDRVVDILSELLARNERFFALSCTRRIVRPHVYIHIMNALRIFPWSSRRVEYWDTVF